VLYFSLEIQMLVEPGTGVLRHPWRRSAGLFRSTTAFDVDVDINGLEESVPGLRLLRVRVGERRR
jgi:hypothetical protein